MAKLGCVFPDFEAETTQGRLHFHDWLGDSWGILFSHPADFTPVCTTELARVIDFQGEFIARNEIDAKGIPLPARAVFIVGADKRLKLSILYPATTGRNFDEILRVIDSLQLTAAKRVATPVDWKAGEKCMVLPNIPPAEAKTIFPEHETVDLPSGKAYLRLTPQP